MILGFTLFTGLLAGSLSRPLSVRISTHQGPEGHLQGGPPGVSAQKSPGRPSVHRIGEPDHRQSTSSCSGQIEYAMERPVGYIREGLITVAINTPDIYGHYDALLF